MSKIGKSPIDIKNGVTVAVQGRSVKVTGPKGNFDYQLPDGIAAVVEENKLKVSTSKSNDKKQSAFFGLARASLANIIKGAEREFEKKLALTGVGYKAQMQGADLVLSLGFSHPVKFKPKTGIKISVVENGVIIAGSDKALVGETAAKIRAIKPPEPYKGKGIKYVGEHIRRKAGKAAKAAGAK